jgi:hypothetical protein
VIFSTLNVTSNAANEGAHRTSTLRSLLADTVDVKGKSVVDLGAGPCIFARICRDAGGLVTAVDGRTDRVPNEEELGSIRFVQSDIRSFDVSAFDVKIVFGLLYHLELPDQMSLLKRCAAGGVTILDTQVHWPNIITCYPQQPWQSKVVSVGAYEGVMFPEMNRTTASIGNPESFWPTEASMNQMIIDVGFKSMTVVDPAYVSKYGVRRFYVCRA